MKNDPIAKKKFPLCFWNYANFDQLGDDPVKMWADAGFGMCVSPVFHPEKDDPAQMIAILDDCEKYGIKVILDDPRGKWTGASVDPDAYRENFREVMDLFGKHPAVYGFYVGDEPNDDQVPDAVAAVRIQLEEAPDKKPFINFLSAEFFQKNGGEGFDFDAWIDGLIARSGLPQLSSDCYSQLNPPDEIQSGIDGYYETLFDFMGAAKRNAIPLWMTDLSVGHFQYRVPSEDDLRWQLNTSVASGASSVWWYFLYLRMCRINYRLSPIDEHGNKTATYYALARVQNTFQRQFGELFTNLSHDETYHTGRCYGGYPLLRFGKHPLVRNVTSSPRLPGVLSFFRAPDGSVYLALVNNSQTTDGDFTVHYTKRVKEVYRVAFTAQDVPRGASGTLVGKFDPIFTEWGSVEVNAEKNDVCNRFARDGFGIRNGAFLAPGQMEVYRLVVEE